jgi:hypothetical protein
MHILLYLEKFIWRDWEGIIFAIPLSAILWVLLARTSIRASRHSNAYQKLWAPMVGLATYWNCTWLLPLIGGLVLAAFDTTTTAVGDGGVGGLYALSFLLIVAPAIYLPAPFVLYFLLKCRPSPKLRSATNGKDTVHVPTVRPILILVPILMLCGYVLRIYGMDLGPGCPTLTISLFLSVIGYWCVKYLKVNVSQYWIVWTCLLLVATLYAYFMLKFVHRSMLDLLARDYTYSPAMNGPTWWRVIRWLSDEPALGYSAVVWLAALLLNPPTKKTMATVMGNK